MTREKFGDSPGVQFNGTKGSIEVHRGHIATNPPELAQRKIAENERRVYFSDNHYKDFLSSIKSRIQPVCDVETGHRTATVCNVGNIAYALNKPLQWDYTQEKFNDAGADSFLKRTMRKEYAV
jgi:hypothetical protein